MWMRADHLKFMRCCARLALNVLTEVIRTREAGLQLLQRDLTLDSVRVELIEAAKS